MTKRRRKGGETGCNLDNIPSRTAAGGGPDGARSTALPRFVIAIFSLVRQTKRALGPFGRTTKKAYVA